MGTTKRIAGDVSGIANNILGQLQQDLGEQWTRFTSAEKDLAAQVSIDAADLLLSAQATAQPYSQQARDELGREQAHVDAQLANLAAGAASSFAGAFWAAVNKVVAAALQIVVATV